MAEHVLTELGLLPCAADPSHAPAPRAFLVGDVSVHVCPDCGTLMTDRSFVADYYEGENAYAVNRSTLPEIQQEWGFRWRRILARLARLSPGPRLLDVGAGNGYFVKLAREESGLEAAGVEMSARAVAFARDVVGVELIHGDVEDVEGEYDAVTSFNVIEHVENPRLFLGSLVSRVRPGGLLVMTTPSPRCVHARLKGLESWSMLHHPEHLNIFTRQGLGTLASGCGLAPLRYETMSTYIRGVRRYDRGGILRSAAFHALLLTGAGADHCLYATRR